MNALWLVLVALVLIAYLWRADFDTYSVFTVGVFKRVTRYKSHNQNRECSKLDCESGTKEGEIRKGWKEIVLFGCPIRRTDSVTNAYCPDHTSFEFQEGEYRETTTRRVAETVLTGLAHAGQLKPETKEDESPFDGAVNTTSACFDLIPMLLLVIIIAACVGAAKTLRGELA